MISSLKLRRRFKFRSYRNELNFRLRQIQELERRRDDYKLHLSTNLNQLHHSQFMSAENSFYEREIEKLNLALEEVHAKIRTLKRNTHY